MVFDVECRHLGIRNLLPCWIVAGVEDRLHDQTSRSLGASNESEHRVPGPQRYAGPVAADLAEQPMLNRVPLRATRRVMTHGHGQPEAIAELDL
jgi:hypothetical protein